MSAHVKKQLRTAAVIATNTTSNSTGQQLHCHSLEIIAISKVSAFTDGVYTTSIQHSPDNSNWYVLAAGNAQTAAGDVVISVSKDSPIFQYVRSSVVSTGTTTGATVAVELWHGVQR